jgi:GTP-binding protein
MEDMHTDHNNNVRLRYKISSQNLLGIRNVLLTNTRGTAIMNTYLLGYEAKGAKMDSMRNGALIASQPGTSMTYGLANAQERGTMFIGPGVNVYEGMIIGVSSKEQDIEVNATKEKKLTNNRSSGEGVAVQLTPPTTLSLEQCLDFLNDDELLEVTPMGLRLRKRYLNETERKNAKRREGN